MCRATYLGYRRLLATVANDILQLYLRGGGYNTHIINITGDPTTAPAIPDCPSIILTIHRIG